MNRRLLLTGLSLMQLACMQKTDCRKYATGITASTGARSTCSLDEKKAQYVCVSGSFSITYAYRHLSEFIEEGHVIGRRRWAGSTSSGAASETILNGIAEDKRVVSSVKVQGSETLSYNMLEWDNYQRPTRISSNYDSGTGNACTGRIETVQFDDVGLSASTQISYALTTGTGTMAGSPCGGQSDASTTYRYDGDHELIAAGSVTYSIWSKGEVCQ